MSIHKLNMQVTGTTPLWLAARSLLSLRCTDFFRRWHQAMLSFDVEDIHDLRVSSRRFREGLALFASAYPQKTAVRLSRQLKKVTSCLGELRNTDEALLYFIRLGNKSGKDARDSLSPLIGSLQTLRDIEKEKVQTVLLDFRPEQMQKKFHAVIARPILFNRLTGNTDPFVLFSTFAGPALAERLVFAMALLGDACNAGETETQHRLRIAIKHFRYRMEILEALVTEGYEPIHSCVKGYQELLGKLHDLEMFMELLKGAPAIAEGSKAKLMSAMKVERDQFFLRFLSLVEEQPLADIGEKLRRVM